MGDQPVTAAAADAGPIIHLSEIGCFSLLRIFHALHIPDAVVEELSGHNISLSETSLGSVSVVRHTLPRDAVARFVRENGFERLHAGETECLFLCKRQALPVILTDDLSVRETAKGLGMKPVGSLGVIVRAYKKGFISLQDAERHLTALHETSSLFVTKAIVEIAIERLKK